MNKKWAMDKGYSNLFTGAQNRKLDFEHFMRLQKDPSFLFSDILSKYSPGFIEVQQKFGVA